MCQNGYFASRIKYLNQRRNQHQKQVVLSNVNEAENSIPTGEANTEVEDMDYLKRAVITKTNFNSVVAKLNTTRSLRQRMLLDLNTDWRESFPFFFSHPKLVSFFVYIQFFRI